MIGAHDILLFAFNHAWQSCTFLIALTGLFALCRRLAPAVRYRLWFLALACAALLPAAAFLPPTGVTMPPALVIARGSDVGALTSYVQTHETDSSQRATASPDEDVPSKSIPLVHSLLLLWAAGVIWGAIRMTLGLLHIASLRRRSSLCILPMPLRRNLETLEVRESREVGSPVAIGLWKPCVVLPSGACQRHGEDELQAVLAHERAHVERSDPLAALVQRVLVSLFWWNPVMHILSRRIEECREMACDQMAARQMGDARLVARALTSFVHAQLTNPPDMRGLAPGATTSAFTRRMRHLLDDAGAAPSRVSAPAILGVVALIALLTSITPRHRAEAASPQSPPIITQQVNAEPDDSSQGQLGAISTSPARLPVLSALRSAVQQQDSGMVRRLIKAGADVKAAEARGEQLLLSAVQNGNTGIVEALIDAGADAGAAQSRGEPVLEIAVRSGNSGIARLLLSAGARP